MFNSFEFVDALLHMLLGILEYIFQMVDPLVQHS